MYGLCLWASDPLIDFSKIYQLKDLKPKNNGHANFYECCDLTKKVYLEISYLYLEAKKVEMLLQHANTFSGLFIEMISPLVLDFFFAQI